MRPFAHEPEKGGWNGRGCRNSAMVRSSGAAVSSSQFPSWRLVPQAGMIMWESSAHALRRPPASRFPPRSKLGRVAIIKSTRGTGAGRILCEALEEHVRERRGKAADVTRGKSSIELLAYSQKIAEGFYAKMGWHSIGPDFIEVRRRPLCPRL
jgi:GNAT superfamily N-acetyltransferase